eukprot:Hpha_TRINITY_DN16790_c3_g7::TRINITY_DN16790_c3_g7_i1::g.80139::m.80139
MAAALQASSVKQAPLPSLQSILVESTEKAQKERQRLASEKTSLRDLYISECKRLQCKKNSGLLQLLPAEPGVFDSMPLLDLSLNCVGRNGIRALYRVVEVAHGLQRILLADNCINNDAARDLILALNGHPNLRQIDLSRNPISHLSGKLLSEFVPLHPQLTSVGLSDTLINPALVRIILRKAEENKGRADGVSPAPAPAAAFRPAAPPDPPADNANTTPTPDLAPASPPPALDCCTPPSARGSAVSTGQNAPSAPQPKPCKPPAAMPSPAPNLPPTDGSAVASPMQMFPRPTGEDVSPARERTGEAPSPSPKRQPLPETVTVEDDWYGVRLLYNTSLLETSEVPEDTEEGLPAWHGIHSVYVAVKQEEAEAGRTSASPDPQPEVPPQAPPQAPPPEPEAPRPEPEVPPPEPEAPPEPKIAAQPDAAQQQPQQSKGVAAVPPLPSLPVQTVGYSVPEEVCHDQSPLEMLLGVANEAEALPINFLVEINAAQLSPRLRKEKETTIDPLRLLYESDGKRSLEIGFLLGDIAPAEEDDEDHSAFSILSRCVGARPELHFLAAAAREEKRSAAPTSPLQKQDAPETAVSELKALLALVDSAGGTVPDPLRFLSDIASPSGAATKARLPLTSPEGLWFPHLGLLMGAADDHQHLRVLQQASTPQGNDQWYAMELVWALASPAAAKAAPDESWSALAAVMTIVRNQESKTEPPMAEAPKPAASQPAS